MTSRLPLKIALIIVLIISNVPLVQADSNDGIINITEVTERTLAATALCTRWKVVGICIWMSCVGPVCTTDTSTKVENYVPEVTVQVYGSGAEEPWGETKEINEVALGSNDSSWVKTIISVIENFPIPDLNGGSPSQAHVGMHKNNQFRIVDIYGNPAAPTFNLAGEATLGLFCSNNIIPMAPHYISNLDSVSWRWSIPEFIYPQSLASFPQLGSLTNKYGGIYPRTGHIEQHDQLKTSVLAAFRAAHFATRTGTPHVYLPIPMRTEPGYWPPGPLEAEGGATGEWQMLHPIVDASCASFPYGRTISAFRRDKKTQYVWNFWRKYKCCRKEGQTLIFHSG